MEENLNNEQPDVNRLQEENAKLKEVLSKVYPEYQKLRQTWMLQRASFLFKVVENNTFSPDVRQKAQEEIEVFLFPPQAEQEAKEEE